MSSYFDIDAESASSRTFGFPSPTLNMNTIVRIVEKLPCVERKFLLFLGISLHLKNHIVVALR
jgi:hypothetical protein